MAKKKQKTYTTTESDLIEGKPMSREAFKNLDQLTCIAWVKHNHPEIKDEFRSILQDEQEIAVVLPSARKTIKVVKDGKPVMRISKKRDGTTVEVQKTETVPYKKGEKVKLNPFQVKTWLCSKYGMLPVSKAANGPIGESFDDYWDKL